MIESIDKTEVLTREELQGLYAIGGIETVHVVTGCDSLSIAAIIGGSRVSQRMPPGNYILVRLVDTPTERPGLFAVRALAGL